MKQTILFIIFLCSYMGIQSQVINPLADAYISLGGTTQANNYGSNTDLRARYSADNASARLSFIRFDLSAMPDQYAAVTFNVYGKIYSGTEKKKLDLYSAFGVWQEDQLCGTANKKPSLADFIGSFEVDVTDNYYSVDITPYIQKIRKEGKTELTIAILDRVQQETGIYVLFHSKENASGFQPYLNVEGGTANTVYDQPNIIYVDAENGNDTASGLSPAQAWKTLQRVEKHFFKSEDKLLFKRGCTFQGSLFIKNLKNSEAIFEVGSYGEGELPLLDAMGKDTYTLKLFNQSNVLVQDLEITNYGTNVQKLRRGLYCQAEDAGEIKNVRFNRLRFSNINGNLGTDDGDMVAKSNCGLYSDITGVNIPTIWNGYTLENCHFYRIDRHGAANFSVWADRSLTQNINWTPSLNMLFRKNIFEECASDGLIVRVAYQPIMEHNLFKRCGYKLSGNACFSFNTDNAIWQFNESCYTVYQTGDADAAGFDSDYKSKNTIIQYNYSHHNEYGSILIVGGPASYGGFNDGTIVRHNVFYNNGHHGIRVSGMTTNTHIYNNTSYNDDNTKEPLQPYNEYPNFRMYYHRDWGGWPQNTTYTNNVYYYSSKKKAAIQDLNIYVSKGTIFSHNLTFGSNILGYPSDENGLRTNPKFLYDVTSLGEGLDEMTKFVLADDSPCRDSGKEIEGAATVDYLGTSIPTNKATDRGAFEYGFPSGIDVSNVEPSLIQLIQNPVLEKLRFRYNESSDRSVNIQILNMQGNLLVKKTVNPKENQEEEIDVANLVSGAYILRIVDGQRTVSSVFLRL